MTAQTIIIVDLDGTLANVDHRVAHVQKDPPDWESFNAFMMHDEVNPWCRELIASMRQRGHSVFLVTGRGEKQREVCVDWLRSKNVSYEGLFMRAANDTRPDAVIKEEIYQKELAHFRVLFVVEDRLSVVRMWRKLGLTCLQCADGDF